jgi:probable phosphoglycerate mutase
LAKITLMRHGETTANAADRWEGRLDSPLTARGEQQAVAVARRLHDRSFDVVATSDLGRAVATASHLGTEFETDPAWREMDLGNWEGCNRSDVLSADGDVLSRIIAGEDLPWGGNGERLAEVVARGLQALYTLADRVGDDGSALVVTHGGVIQSVLGGVLDGGAVPWPFLGITNTALTTVRVGEGASVLDLNDAFHLRNGIGALEYDPPGTALVLVRHAESEANAAGRWQGHSDASLTARGKLQAARLAESLRSLDAVYTSPLGRARDTATALAHRAGCDVELREDLKEMAFGSWEGLRPDEVAVRYPDAWTAIYDEGRDLPRGGNGETFGAAGARLTASLAGIAAAHPGQRVAVVSHGGALRAYAASLLGIAFRDRHRIAAPRNTATARLVFGEKRTALADWNLIAHLDA